MKLRLLQVTREFRRWNAFAGEYYIDAHTSEPVLQIMVKGKWEHVEIVKETVKEYKD